MLFVIFLCMSPTRLGYRELGFELIKPIEHFPCQPKQPPMADKNKENKVGDPLRCCFSKLLGVKE